MTHGANAFTLGGIVRSELRTRLAGASGAAEGVLLRVRWTIATSGRNAVAPSQLALPKASCDEVFETSGYEASVNNLAALSLATDNVFRDGVSLQPSAMTGTLTDGHEASLDVTILP